MICDDFGSTSTAAITVFMKTVVHERRIPFEIRASGKEQITKQGSMGCLHENEGTENPHWSLAGPLMGIVLHSVLNTDMSTAVLDVNRRPSGKLLH